METSLIPFLPISTEEETSFATLTLHREEREAVRESNCIFLSLLLHAFLIKRGERCVEAVRPRGLGDRSLDLRINNQAIKLLFFNMQMELFLLPTSFFPKGASWAVLFFLSPHRKSNLEEPRLCFYQPFSLFHLWMGVWNSPTIFLALALSSSTHNKNPLQAQTYLYLPGLKDKVTSPTSDLRNHRVHTQTKKTNPLVIDCS